MEYFKENIIEDIDASILLNPMFDEWYLIVDDILKSREFQKRKIFMHHHNVTVWEHSIIVSFKAFLVAKYWGFDARVCAIAGLLHDFYTQAWISTPEIEKLDGGVYATKMKEKKKFWELHGFTHGPDASVNYVKYFPELENKKITDAIKRHMFPLTIIPPRYIEGYVITIVDKMSSCSELVPLKELPAYAVKKTVGLFHKN